MPAANTPRAVWTGSISFGLVNAPVRMYTAISEKDLRFNLIHEPDNGRIGYVKMCKVDGKEVPSDEIVKAYEVSKGEYVTPDRRGLRRSAGRGRPLDHDPRLRARRPDRPDLLRADVLPRARGGRGRGDLRAAREGDGATPGLAAVATYVRSDRENLACLRVRDGVITLERMFFDDEVRSIDGIAPSSAKVDKRQLEMARDLIGAYTTERSTSRSTRTPTASGCSR